MTADICREHEECDMEPCTRTPRAGQWVVWAHPGLGPSWAHEVASTDPFAVTCGLVLAGDPMLEATFSDEPPGYACVACTAGHRWDDALFQATFLGGPRETAS